MFRLLQKTHIRIGNECYADKTRENGPTYGLTTLEKRHVLINGSEITLDFIGKKNVRNTITINSASLSRDLLILKDSCKNTDRIFKTTDNIIVGSNDMNNFLNEAIGSTEFSCKDFRTYASNISFIKKLCLFKNTKDMSQKTIEQNIKSIFKDVSKELNHSEAISKGSYIIPHILERYKEDPLYFKKSDSVDNLLIKLL